MAYITFYRDQYKYRLSDKGLTVAKFDIIDRDFYAVGQFTLAEIPMRYKEVLQEATEEVDLPTLHTKLEDKYHQDTLVKSY